jgi:hypothetical protein
MVSLHKLIFSNIHNEMVSGAGKLGKKEDQPHCKENEDEFRILVRSVKDYAIYMIDPEGYIQT